MERPYPETATAVDRFRAIRAHYLCGAAATPLEHTGPVPKARGAPSGPGRGGYF